MEHCYIASLQLLQALCLWLQHVLVTMDTLHGKLFFVGLPSWGMVPSRFHLIMFD